MCFNNICTFLTGLKRHNIRVYTKKMLHFILFTLELRFKFYWQSLYRTPGMGIFVEQITRKMNKKRKLKSQK